MLLRWPTQKELADLEDKVEVKADSEQWTYDGVARD